MNTIKRRIPADERLAVIPTEACNPVVIFSEPKTLLNEIAINFSGSVSDFREQSQLPVSLQEKPCFLSGIEKYRQFPDTDGGYEKTFRAVSG